MNKKYLKEINKVERSFRQKLTFLFRMRQHPHYNFFIKIQLQKYHNIIKKKVHRRLRVALVAGWNQPKNTLMKLNNLEDNDR